VDENRIGAIVIGGLNPVAILEEVGVKVYSGHFPSSRFPKLFPTKSWREDQGLR